LILEYHNTTSLSVSPFHHGSWGPNSIVEF
jgi:hypothetical protein